MIYLLNHTAAPQSVKVAGSYKDVLTGSTHADSVSLDPYGVCILQPA